MIDAISDKADFQERTFDEELAHMTGSDSNMSRGDDPSIDFAAPGGDYSVAGFDIGMLRLRDSAKLGRVFVRVLQESKMRRPVSARRRRLCERYGHPRSRLAPEYSATPSPIRQTRGPVEVSFDDIQPAGHFCYRCGRSTDAR